MPAIRPLTKIVLTALSLSAAASASAAAISGVVVTGARTIWGVSASGVLIPGVGTVAEALTGNAADPTGNVELGKFGSSPATTLTGTVDGISITLSSLLLGDWTANSNALATRYIQDAAVSAFGAPLLPGDLTTALNKFFTLDLDARPAVVLNPWQLVSDPNISYVNGDDSGDGVSIGLAGIYDGSDFLSAISGISLDDGKQASEVVKVTYLGKTEYLYGFSATPSGYCVGAPGCADTTSYTGNFQVRVPEPSILWLAGLGLAGLFASRRRR